MGKIKLLVNALSLNNIDTGIGRYIRNLYSELERNYSEELSITYFDGVKLTSKMPEGPGQHARWSLLTDLFWRLPPRLGALVRVVLHSRREARFYKLAGDFDIYHEPGLFPFRVPAHVKTVFTLHDMSVQRCPEYHPRERVLFYSAFFEKRIQCASQVLTVSEFSKKEIVRLTKLTPQQITVTPLGYHPELFHRASKKERLSLRQKYDLPEHFFVFLGTGDPRKNLASIPKALESAKLDVPLLVVGWAGWEAKRGDRRVRCLGYLPDHELRAVLSSATAMVYPSFYEGFGLPVLEAMACGCPVVTTRVASMPEVAEEAALYVESPEDVHELGEQLKKVYASKAVQRALRDQGLRQAEKFRWSKTAEQTMEVFRDVFSA